MKKIKPLIVSNKEIAPGHYVMELKNSYLAIHAKPGQFINIKCNDTTVPLLRKPFGVHKIGKDGIEILYKVVGSATQILSKKKKGDNLDVLGPLGNGFNLTNSKPGLELVMLVAGGHGVAPLYALALRLSVIGYRFSVFIGARTEKHIVCDREFEKLGARVFIATEDSSKGYKGLVTDLLVSKLPNTEHRTPNTEIYACGPKPMLKAVAKIANKYNIPCQISIEEYIGCGTGVCIGCSIKTRSGNKLVCKDGPVFDSRDIVW